MRVYYENGKMENILVPIDEDDEDEDEEPIQEPVVVEITRGGEGGVRSGQNIVVLFLGDGFRDTQSARNLFDVKTTEAMNHLLRYYPFNLFSQNIKVYTMYYISKETGVSRDVDHYNFFTNNPKVNNYFGSRFYHDGKTERMLYVTSPNNVNLAIKSAWLQIGTPPSLTIVLANSIRDGGSAKVGGNFGVASIRDVSTELTNFRHTVTHELGHAFGGLADEYWWKGKETPNMTKDNNKATVKWKGWIHPLHPVEKFDGVTIERISPSGQTAWYVPTEKDSEGDHKCHMGHNWYGFCAVCSEHLISLMASISGKAGYLYDNLPGGEARITGLGSGLIVQSKIFIPSRISGKTVSEIGLEAFQGTNINDVRIPDTVKTVGRNAFFNTWIWKTTTNNNVVYADKWAVGVNEQINGTLVLEHNTIGIGNEAFYLKNISNDLIIPYGVRNIGMYAFYDNPSLQRVWIPSSVTYIGPVTFHNSPSLTIYAQAVSQPGGWDDYWNPNNFPVIWNSPAAFIAPVSIAAISGVTVPATGETPVTAITETLQFTGKVIWKNSAGVQLTGGQTFAPGTQYTATITLKAKTDFTLQGVSANFFTVPGAISVTNAADSGIVTAVFPATNASTINIAAVSGVTAPVAGASPSTAITETSQFSGTVSWMPPISNGFFAAGTQYTATITLVPKTGYTLQGVPADFFTVAGTETSATNAADSGVVTAVFPVTASTISISVIQGLDPPEAGERPVSLIIANGQFSGSVSWSPAMASDGTFEYNTVYTATITLTANPGFTLYGVPANYFTVYGAASVNNAADGNKVYASFPAFGYFGGGDGTQSSPYLISNKSHFMNMAVYGNSFYKLTDDIILAEYPEFWTPMPFFEGELDGSDYTVVFYMIEDENYNEFTGLFRVNNGKINNLNVCGLLRVGHNGVYAGLIAGKNEAAGIIEWCTSDTRPGTKGGTYMIFNTYGGSYCGGIAGINEGTIGNCTNDGIIDSAGTNGDIAAVNNGVIY